MITKINNNSMNLVKLNNPGTEWSPLAKVGTTGINSIMENNGRVFFAGVAKIFYSDHLITFHEATLSHTTSDTFYSFAKNIDGTLLAGSRYYIWRSTNNGENWTRTAALYCKALINLNDTYAVGGGGTGRGTAYLINFATGTSIRTVQMEDSGLNGWVASITKITDQDIIFGTGQTGNAHIHISSNQLTSVCPRILEVSADGNPTSLVDSYNSTAYALIPEIIGSTIRKSLDAGHTWEILHRFGSQINCSVFKVVNENISFVNELTVLKRSTNFVDYEVVLTDIGNASNIIYQLPNGRLLLATSGITTCNVWISN